MKLIEKLKSIDSPLVTNEIIKSMKKRIAENICFDKTKWNEYVAQPLDFADSPNSLWYDDMKQGVEENFQFWIDSISHDGIWNPNYKRIALFV